MDFIYILYKIIDNNKFSYSPEYISGEIYNIIVLRYHSMFIYFNQIFKIYIYIFIYHIKKYL